MSRFLRNAAVLGQFYGRPFATLTSSWIPQPVLLTEGSRQLCTSGVSSTSKFREIASPQESGSGIPDGGCRHRSDDEDDVYGEKWPESDYFSSDRPGSRRYEPRGERRFNYDSRRFDFDSTSFSRDSHSDLGSNLKDKDWSDVQLEEGVVNHYQVHTSMTAEEAQHFRKENRITLLTDEELVPPPVRSFEEAEFPDYISAILRDSGFESPMPVQAQGWPVALSGKNLIAIGETGSGKTLGYLLPALVHVGNKRPARRGDGPSALVLAPTRELAQQIQSVLSSYTRASRLRSVCLFGGASKGPQLRALHGGIDLVIATPGRLIDLLEMQALNLNRCTYVVLDEADRMMDMGFEPQIRKVMGQVRPDRQMLMWSATWPDEVKDLAQDFLAVDGEERHVHLNIGSVELQANNNIKQNVRVLDPHEKQSALLSLLQSVKNDSQDRSDPCRVLIFVQTKRTVDYVEMMLNRNGYVAAGIHGGKTQMQRDRCLQGFRRGRVQILVATDVASRGLDVDDIQHVVNYDFPNTVEDYIHRIGRTGRRNRKGTSHTFFTSVNGGCARDLIKVMKQAGQEVPEDLDALKGFRSEKSFSKSFRSRGYDSSWGGGERHSRYNRDFAPRRRQHWNLQSDE